MVNKTKICEARDFLKDSVFEEIDNAGKEGITVSSIAKNLGLNVAAWKKHSVGANYLVWALLAILNEEKKISSEKGGKARIFSKKGAK